MDKKSLIEKIDRLKEQENAVILAHNYQAGDVQDIADFVGDSLGLSQAAAETGYDVIVFCGVYFMAETASIICPEKTVILPDIHAGCRMAEMISKTGLDSLKKKNPGSPIVCYVNTTAEIKAESDICCTSSNAVKIVESIDDPRIIFIPDKYLASYVMAKTEKEVIPWEGFCPTHAFISSEDIMSKRLLYPEAKVIVHPECTPQVIALSDEVQSTGGMVRYVRDSDALEYIVGTEVGLLHRLRKENPQKRFYPASELAVCLNMKLINLEKIYWSLKNMKNIIKVNSRISNKARTAINRMLKVT